MINVKVYRNIENVSLEVRLVCMFLFGIVGNKERDSKYCFNLFWFFVRKWILDLEVIREREK